MAGRKIKEIYTARRALNEMWRAVRVILRDGRELTLLLYLKVLYCQPLTYQYLISYRAMGSHLSTACSL